MVIFFMVSAVQSGHIKQLFFRPSSSRLDSFQLLSCFNLTKLINKFSTNSLCKCIVKFGEIHSSLSRPKILKDFNNSFSKMSFYKPAGLGVSSKYNGTIPESKTMQTLRHYEVLDRNNYYNPEPGISVKVMNYNVLSQSLLELHHYLYRKQSPQALSWDYRSHLILAEILAVSPDVLCLQEVDAAHVSTFYKNLENYGYRIVTKMKTGHKPDGLAILYRIPDIKLLETETVEYRQPGVVQLASRDNVGLIVKLEKNGKKFLVCNTHLLYNPKRTEVRLAQLQIFLAEIDRIRRKESDGIEVMLMGDLNSTPESPVIRLLTEGKLISPYRPLPSCLGVSPGSVHMEQRSKLYHSQKQTDGPCEGEEEILPNFNQSSLLSHSFNFLSAYNLTENEQRGITTFQNEWVLVDYIFYTSGINLTSRLRLPTASECDAHVHFLPNLINPSDHLPLVADFVVH